MTQYKSEILKEYMEELEAIGFHSDTYSIDFSDVSSKDTLAICQFIRTLNAEK